MLIKNLGQFTLAVSPIACQSDLRSADMYWKVCFPRIVLQSLSIYMTLTLTLPSFSQRASSFCEIRTVAWSFGDLMLNALTVTMNLYIVT